MDFLTADISDLNPDDTDVCDVEFRSYGARQDFFGECETIKVFEDHVAIRELLEQPGEGRVLVVDGAGSSRIAIFGDGMANTAAKNGWSGIIVYGAIRDSRGINAVDIGVRALGTTARKSLAESEGRSGIPVQIGSTSFHPGNWIYVDADAVVVSRKKLSKVKK